MCIAWPPTARATPGWPPAWPPSSPPQEIEHWKEHDPQQVDHVPVEAARLEPAEERSVHRLLSRLEPQHREHGHADHEVQEVDPGEHVIEHEEVVAQQGDAVR